MANDWTHSNSLAYTQDGNLLLSVRHQDWVIKIDYQNGTGSGRILWRLGKDGDFRILSTDPNPWFSHQHDVEFDVAGYPALSLYDNGNVRHAADAAARSRGQVLWLDEAQHLAIPLVNADLGVYSGALGSAQRLCNGDYSFDSGAIQHSNGGATSRTTEVLLDGSVGFVLENATTTYRTFRLSSMYQQYLSPANRLCRFTNGTVSGVRIAPHRSRRRLKELIGSPSPRQRNRPVT